jgi:hypothetical protein
MRISFMLFSSLVLAQTAYAQNPVFETAARCNESNLHPEQARNRVLSVWIADNFTASWAESPTSVMDPCVSIPASFPKRLTCQFVP